MENEIWKKVNGYEHIEVSNLGRVRRVSYVSTKKGFPCTYPEKAIAQRANKDGYPCVQLWLDGKRSIRPVHRLVFEAFNEPCEPPYVIDHIDNDKTNNRLENLQKTTTRINTSKDRWRTKKSDLPVGVMKHGKKYVATSVIDGKHVYFGTFTTIDDAVNALSNRLVVRRRFACEDGYKVCTRCGEKLPIGDFYKQGPRPSGRCKKCISEIEKEKRQQRHINH